MVAGVEAGTTARSGWRAAARPERVRSPGAGLRPCPPVEIVAIGASSAGPDALAALVRGLPVDLGVPVVAVGHLPGTRTRLLVQRLDHSTALRVREGVDGAPLLAGQVWIAPGGPYMVVDRRDGIARVGLRDSAPGDPRRPSADVLLRAAAGAFGPGVLAVVLAGTGEDGLHGCEQVKAAGGHVLAQDRASRRPGAVVGAGLADGVLGLSGMAGEIATRVRGSRGEAAALRKASPAGRRCR